MDTNNIKYFISAVVGIYLSYRGLMGLLTGEIKLTDRIGTSFAPIRYPESISISQQQRDYPSVLTNRVVVFLFSTA